MRCLNRVTACMVSFKLTARMAVCADGDEEDEEAAEHEDDDEETDAKEDEAATDTTDGVAHRARCSWEAAVAINAAAFGVAILEVASV